MKQKRALKRSTSKRISNVRYMWIKTRKGRSGFVKGEKERAECNS